MKIRPVTPAFASIPEGKRNEAAFNAWSGDRVKKTQMRRGSSQDLHSKILQERMLESSIQDSTTSTEEQLLQGKVKSAVLILIAGSEL